MGFLQAVLALYIKRGFILSLLPLQLHSIDLYELQCVQQTLYVGSTTHLCDTVCVKSRELTELWRYLASGLVRRERHVLQSLMRNQMKFLGALTTELWKNILNEWNTAWNAEAYLLKIYGAHTKCQGANSTRSEPYMASMAMAPSPLCAEWLCMLVHMACYHCFASPRS